MVCSRVLSTKKYSKANEADARPRATEVKSLSVNRETCVNASRPMMSAASEAAKTPTVFLYAPSDLNKSANLVEYLDVESWIPRMTTEKTMAKTAA